MNDLGGVPVNRVEGATLGHSSRGEDREVERIWISPFGGPNQLRPSLWRMGCIYRSLCLIAHIAAAGDRT